ncbi:Fumagillin dodecapentaenoate synthase [Apiospora marii]|uniref:Fumagillin dodecapentaenoate synthase n=1 Tax=Apiospora marii TaxID=335849 RepID=UPI0031327357
MTPNSQAQTPIAVVGLACRLPGSCNSPEQFWKFLLEGAIADSTPPSSRFNLAGHYDGTLRPWTMRSPGGMFIDVDPKDIDAGFFGLSQADAISMDPQQRQLLEVVYEGLESAGLTLEGIRSKLFSCVVGSYASDYNDIQSRDPEDKTPSYTVGSGRAMLSNRISHFLDIKGPSVTIDTACSGSLVSVDLACRYLESGDADGAIVAGCNLYMSPEHNMDQRAMASAASTSGRCWTFDASADGYIKAEAINALVLKRLDDAIRDGDPVRAVIRGTSTNSDGWTPGIASPSADAQAVAIRRAYARAGIEEFQDTAFLECHGTGTPAGDPIECRAVSSVFSSSRTPDTPLLIGSVKSNIGHSEPAAGISGLIKAILAVEHGIIPGNPTFQTPNPAIDFYASRLLPSSTTAPWPSGMLRRASVNSFGYGGSNAHAIVEHPSILLPEYEPKGATSQATQEDNILGDWDEDDSRKLLVFSANDEWSLRAQVKAIVRHLANPATTLQPADLAYTLDKHRTRHFHRGYAIFDGSTLREEDLVYEKPRSISHIGFVFTGQGSQWPQMGRDLIQNFPLAETTIRRLDKALQTMAQPPTWTLMAELVLPRSAEHLRCPEFSQPLVTALQLCLLAVLKDWGLSPSMVVSHSSGEIAAAVAAGRLKEEDGIRVAYLRGKAASDMQRPENKTCSGQGMLAIGLGSNDCQRYMSHFPQVTIACHNSPKSITLSGGLDELEAVRDAIKADGHFARLLQVDLAYHSEYMDTIASRYRDLLEENSPCLTPSRTFTEVQFFSTVLGKLHQTTCDIDYWVANMVSPVLFDQAVSAMINNGEPNFLIEIGPSSSLAGPINQIKQALSDGGVVTEYSASWSRDSDPTRTLYNLAGKIHLRGVDIDLLKVNGLDSDTKHRTITDLPTYCWNHSVKYWHESLSSHDWRYRPFPVHDLLGSKVLGTSWEMPSFKRTLRLKDVPWLKDHTLGTEVIFPAAAYLSMAVEAMFQTARCAGVEGFADVNDVSQASYRLRDVRLLRALTLDHDTDTYIYLFLHPIHQQKDSWHRFKISTLRGTAWTEHCNGLIRPVLTAAEEHPTLEPLQHQSSSQPWFKAMKAVGFNFGPSFLNWTEVESVPGKKSNRAKVSFPPPSTWDGESKYPIHPTLFDTFLQVAIPSVYEGNRTSINQVLVPRLIDQMIISPISGVPQNAITESHSKYSGGRPDKAENFSYSTTVYDELSKKVLTKIEGLHYTDLHLPGPQKAAQIYMRSEWKPDITLLHGVDINSLPNAGRELDVLSSGLRLPCDATMVLLLLKHKLAASSVLDLDLTNDSECDDTAISEAELKSQLSSLSRYVFASSTKEHLLSAQRRLSNLRMTEFHMYDGISQGDNISVSGAKFNMVFLRTHATGVQNLERAINNVRRFLTPTSFLVLVVGRPLRNAVQLGAQTTAPMDIIDAVLPLTGLILQSRSSSRPFTSTDSSAVFLCRPDESALSQSKIDFVTVDLSRGSSHCSRLIQCLRSLGWGGALVSIQEAGIQPIDTPLLLIDDPESPLLTTIDERDWADLRKVMTAGRKLLWLTSGSQLQVSTPSNAVVYGFARSVRGEEPTLMLKTLDLSTFTSRDAAPCVLRVMGTFSRLLHEEHGNENEYCEQNGVVYINRLCPNERIIAAAGQSRIGRPLINMLLHRNPKTVRMYCERLGAMDSLHFNEVASQPSTIGEGEIEVEIRATGLNYKDIAVASGIVPDDEHMLGSGGAGVIKEVGSKVTSYKAGDRVLLHDKGCFANRHRVPKENVFLLPDSASFEEAATLSVVYFTVVYGLIDLARVCKGQSVLIHSAAGGVGIASIQVCRYLGAEIYATVGSDEKRRFLESHQGIPPGRIFNSRNIDFAAGIRSLTDGRGVDCVINSLTGDLLDESWRLLADNGTFIEIGKRDILDRNSLSMEPFNRNCTFRGVDISKPSILYNPPLVERILQKIRSLWVEGHIKPISPMKVFSFANIPDAMKLLRSGKHIGKIVISDGDVEDIEVPIRPAALAPTFDPQAAYLIVGGLRGLCGSLAVYLARSGVKNFIIMSRSGAGDDRSRRIIRDLTSIGTATRVCSGDVSVFDDVVDVFRNSLLPVRGVIQGAMVLRDKTFESMTVQEYHEALTCKVTGTWNLHHAAAQTQHSLDFFTMLSSISGIVGTAGQANYCAGNSFQDAFAQYRHSLGLPAHTIDLGIVEDVGYMSEHQDLTDRVRSRSKLPGISEQQLHEILKFSILQQQQQQMITGLPYPLPPDSPVLQSDMRFSSLAVSSTLAHSNPSDAADLAGGDPADSELRVFEAMRKAGVPADKLVPEVVRLVGRQFVRSLGLTADMEESKPLSSFGIDSLAAVDLRNWVKVHLKTELTTLEVLNSESLGALCQKIVGRILEPEKS